MGMSQKQAVLDCCNCGPCETGCCMPVNHDNPLYEPRGTPKNIPFCISAPNCLELDGYCGEMMCGGAIPAIPGPCGICHTCLSGGPFLLGAWKYLVSSPLECLIDSCSINLCLSLVCLDGATPTEGIEDCCSKFRLFVGTSTKQEEDDSSIMSAGLCISWKSVEPTTCVCAENDEDMPAVEFPLSLSFVCDEFHVGGTCDGLPKCCMFLTTCDLTDAKVII